MEAAGARVPTDQLGGHNTGMDWLQRETLPCHYPAATNEGFIRL